MCKSTISFGFGLSDYLIMRGIEICTKVPIIFALACILFNYEKTEKRHFGNIFTPFGVGEFTGMEGNMGVFLTVGEMKIWTKTELSKFYRCERIYRITKTRRKIWAFF